MSVLAAAYAFGIAKNHPFVDGNKRAAFAATMVFLRKNRVAFAPDQGAATRIFFERAAGVVGEDALADWIETSITG
jgi:death on curing protein